MRIALFACMALAVAPALGATEYLGVRLSEPPAPAPKPTESKPAEKLSPEKREAIRAAAKEAEAKEEYICSVIHAIRLAEHQERTAVPPERDEYRRYLLDKQRQEEARNDPEVAEIRARFRDDSVRDDYRAWIHSEAYARWKATWLKDARAGEADKKSRSLLWEFLKGTQQTHKPSPNTLRDE